MTELNTEHPKKAGFVNTRSARASRQARIEQEEKDLEKLLKGEDNDEEVKEAEPALDSKDEHQETKEASEDSEPLSAEERSFKKRYGDLRRHSQKQVNDLTAKIEDLEKRLSNSPSVVAPKSDEDIEAWKKKYPDVASIVETIAQRQANTMFEKANSRLTELDNERAELSRVKAEEAIRKAHPDFDRLRDDDSFHDWVDSQSKWVQDALYENDNDATAVINVIDLYKVKTGKSENPAKRNAKEAASAVNTRGTKPVKSELESEKPIYSESQIQNNSDAWFEKHMDAIQEAMADGRFKYDLSK